jgi:uncharacterized protein (TIGR03382 family)
MLIIHQELDAGEIPTQVSSVLPCAQLLRSRLGGCSAGGAGTGGAASLLLMAAALIRRRRNA